LTAEQARTEVAATAITNTTSALSSTTLTGYAEVNYTRPRDGKDAQTDVRRAVIGFQHRFNEKTKAVFELETEHAVTSAGDRGEVAVEQAYVDHELTKNLSVRAGLYLIPLGLINENHEPHAFYGVNRNRVETAIIPSTYREAGVMLIGNTDSGLTYKAGIQTYFDASKFDSMSAEAKESPLYSIHQEGQLAKSKDLSFLASLDWRGYSGLLVGAGFITGKAGQGLTLGANPRVTLADVHARWTPGKWDLSALYAMGRISNAGALNLKYAADVTPIPAKFDGGYVQAAYHLWRSGDYQLTPFARFERLNTAKTYDGFPAGLGRAGDPYERIITVGANFNLAPTVVVKADIQRYQQHRDKDSFNVGIGYAF
jgi:hypothetical protein